MLFPLFIASTMLYKGCLQRYVVSSLRCYLNAVWVTCWTMLFPVYMASSILYARVTSWTLLFPLYIACTMLHGLPAGPCCFLSVLLQYALVYNYALVCCSCCYLLSMRQLLTLCRTYCALFCSIILYPLNIACAGQYVLHRTCFVPIR